MGKQGKKKISVRRYPLLVAAAMLAFLLSIGVSFARYQTQTEIPFSLLTADETAMQTLLNTTGSWRKNDAGNYGMGFTLSNGSDEEYCSSETQKVTLELFATVSDLAAAKETNPATQVTLQAAGLTFTGTPEPITDRSVFYEKYGPGQIYRFFTAAGEEIIWTLPGGQLTQIPMELEVKYGKENTCFMLMALPLADD